MSAALIAALRLAREYVVGASQRMHDGTNGEGIRSEATRRLEVIDAALSAAPEPVEPVAPTKEALTDLIASMLNATYHCGRVWSAWNVVFANRADISPVDESDTPAEIADAVLALYAAPPAPASIAQPLTDADLLKIAQTMGKRVQGVSDYDSWGPGYAKDETGSYCVPIVPRLAVPYARAILTAAGSGNGK